MDRDALKDALTYAGVGVCFIGLLVLMVGGAILFGLFIEEIGDWMLFTSYGGIPMIGYVGAGILTVVLAVAFTIRHKEGWGRRR